MELAKSAKGTGNICDTSFIGRCCWCWTSPYLTTGWTRGKEQEDFEARIESGPKGQSSDKAWPAAADWRRRQSDWDDPVSDSVVRDTSGRFGRGGGFVFFGFKQSNFASEPWRRSHVWETQQAAWLGDKTSQVGKKHPLKIISFVRKKYQHWVRGYYG